MTQVQYDVMLDAAAIAAAEAVAEAGGPELDSDEFSDLVEKLDGFFCSRIEVEE